MTDFSIKLSAYLDGELSDEEALIIEEKLATDPKAKAEMEQLLRADNFAKEQYETMLHEPIPLALAQHIKSSSIKETRQNKSDIHQTTSTKWQSLAASFMMLALGAAGGYYISEQRPAPSIKVAKAGWLKEIASYHAIYARQKRHLVEVPGTEVKHIEKWLGKTIGAGFTVPDLTDQNLSFEGARLLVAAGKPVAQLIYKQTDGTIIALCLKKKNAGAPNVLSTPSVESVKSVESVPGAETEMPAFKATLINNFDFVSWTAGEANYVIVGPPGAANLKELAIVAAKRV